MHFYNYAKRFHQKLKYLFSINIGYIIHGKAFMKHSVEVRLPFQDSALVEFLVVLPSFYRFKDGKVSKNPG